MRVYSTDGDLPLDELGKLSKKILQLAFGREVASQIVRGNSTEVSKADWLKTLTWIQRWNQDEMLSSKKFYCKLALMAKNPGRIGVKGHSDIALFLRATSKSLLASNLEVGDIENLIWFLISALVYGEWLDV